MNETEKDNQNKFGVIKKERYQNIDAGRYSGIRDQLEWMKRQMEYLNFSEQYKLRYNLKRGEIYEIDWGLNVNAEFSNRHYGVVMMDSNEYNPLVMVCPLKTNHNGAHPRSDVDLGIIPGLGTMVSTLAVINQVRTVDKLRIYKRQVIGEKNLHFAENDGDIDYEASIPVLNEVKMGMILNAYFQMIANNNL